MVGAGVCVGLAPGLSRSKDVDGKDGSRKTLVCQREFGSRKTLVCQRELGKRLQETCGDEVVVSLVNMKKKNENG